MKRIVLLPIMIAPLILLSPVILAGKTLFWGTVSLQFIPWRWYAWEMIRSGNLPLWNPLSGMGAPLLANYQSALLYPPNWLAYILGAAGGIGWFAWSQGLLVLLHLIWAGIGMAVLARRLGQKELGQIVSGLAFSLSAYLVGRAGFFSINTAVAWLPWLLAVSLDVQAVVNSSPGQRKLMKPLIWRVGILALCMAMQLLAGHAQITWYSFLLTGLWVAYFGWRFAYSHTNGLTFMGELWKRLRSSLLALGLCMVAMALAGLLAAIQLLPTAEYLGVSQRSSEVGYEFASTYSFWPWRFLTLLAPDLFGNPVRGDYWGYGNYWEDALYIGLLPFLLGVGVAIRAVLKRRNSQEAQWFAEDGEASISFDSPGVRVGFIRFLIILTLASFILALGKNTPVFPWLYAYIPTFDLFQAPTRWTLWVELILPLLAGYGVEQWRRPTQRALYWSRLAVAGAFAITLGAGLAWYALREINPTFLRAAALAGITGVGCSVLNLLAPKDTIPGSNKTPNLELSWWSWAVVAFLSIDLIVANWGLNPATGIDFFTGSNSTIQNSLANLGDQRLYLPKEDEYDLKFKRFMKFDSFEAGEEWRNLRRVVLPNLNILDGIASANNFDPLLPGRYQSWMAAVEQASPETRGAMLNLMAVGAVEHMDSTVVSGVRFERTPGGERLRWVPCAVGTKDAEEALQTVLNEQVDYSQRVVLETTDGQLLGRCQFTSEEAQIRIVSQNPNYLAVEVEAPNTGWLVLSDTWFPGWKARIDGKSANILHANYLFRAVPVTRGSQVVEFIYSPVSFWTGAIISLISWLCIGVTLFLVNQVRSA